VGDIVEASVAFVAVPIQGKRYIAMPQLRALTLLDNSKCQVRKTLQKRPLQLMPVFVVNNQPAKKDPMGSKHSGLLKRKMLYMPEDNVDET
jgi:hypothetical protein